MKYLFLKEHGEVAMLMASPKLMRQEFQPFAYFDLIKIFLKSARCQCRVKRSGILNRRFPFLRRHK